MVKIRTKIDIKVGAGSRIASKLYTFDGLSCDREHIALKVGVIKPGSIPLVRIHSECLTGDVFGSSRCDCGDQLNEALETMSHCGGFVLYLRQEGRGIGLYPKIDAYRLQDAGHDTYAANSILGFPHDSRNFDVAVEMLRALEIEELELLTNNPMKVEGLVTRGINVMGVVNTQVYEKDDNVKYLHDKARIKSHAIHK